MSSINFGTPTVQSTVSALTLQPCEFDSSDGQGDQMYLKIDDLPAFDRYCFSCKVVLTGSWSSQLGSFSVHFDAPQVRTVKFYIDGAVRYYFLGGLQNLTTVSFDTQILLEVEIGGGWGQLGIVDAAGIEPVVATAPPPDDHSLVRPDRGLDRR